MLLNYKKTAEEDFSKSISGTVNENEAIDLLNCINWNHWQRKVEEDSQNNEFSSPAIYFARIHGNHALHFTIARNENMEWKILVFYSRSRLEKRKKRWRTVDVENKDYNTGALFEKENIPELLMALIKGDFEFLENRVVSEKS